MMKTTRTTAMTSVLVVVPGGDSGGSALALLVILTKASSGRRAIRTTTGRALRVGRWSAPKPRRERRRGRRGLWEEGGSGLNRRLQRFVTCLSQWRTGAPLRVEDARTQRGYKHEEGLESRKAREESDEKLVVTAGREEEDVVFSGCQDFQVHVPLYGRCGHCRC